jgi:hypothetical protein
MKKLLMLGFCIFLLAWPLVTLAATITIVHSCDNYGEVVPCG